MKELDIVKFVQKQMLFDSPKLKGLTKHLKILENVHAEQLKEGFIPLPVAILEDAPAMFAALATEHDGHPLASEFTEEQAQETWPALGTTTHTKEPCR